MDITRYVNDLQYQLAVSAEAGGSDARVLAERLSASLEATARLILLEALSDAASEITRELAPILVDVRLRGRDPEFVVTRPPDDLGLRTIGEPRHDAVPVANQPVPAEADEGNISRTTLRLPEQLKQRVEEAAAQQGLSVNAWLVRAIAAALEPNDRRQVQQKRWGGERHTGWFR